MNLFPRSQKPEPTREEKIVRQAWRRALLAMGALHVLFVLLTRFVIGGTETAEGQAQVSQTIIVVYGVILVINVIVIGAMELFIIWMQMNPPPTPRERTRRGSDTMHMP